MYIYIYIYTVSRLIIAVSYREYRIHSVWQVCLACRINVRPEAPFFFYGWKCSWESRRTWSEWGCRYFPGLSAKGSWTFLDLKKGTESKVSELTPFWMFVVAWTRVHRQPFWGGPISPTRSASLFPGAGLTLGWIDVDFGDYTIYIYYTNIYIYTLWLFNIAMENGPCIDGLPIKKGDFPWLC